jgi:extradiol dioxygenase family protein
MSELDERMDALRTKQAEHAKDADRLGQVFADVFGTESGREALAHLVKRFDLLGRVHIATERGEVNAIRAGIRDGERAVVGHILQLCRKGNPQYILPL